MAATLQDLRNIFYAILREEEDTSAYPLVMVDMLLNIAQKKICAGRVINPLTKEEAGKGELSFVKGDHFYSTIQDLYTDTDLTTLDTEISTTTEGYPDTGTLMLGGNIIEYTGRTATEFTGCSGIQFDFPAGTSISYVYTLPTDYSSVINLIYKDKRKIRAENFDRLFEGLNSRKGFDITNIDGLGKLNAIGEFYTIKDGKYLILYNLNEAKQLVKLRYEKKPTEMVLATDETTLDDVTYAKSTIPYLAVGEMLFNRGEEARAGQILNFAIGQVREMYDYYNKREFEKVSGTQYRIGKSGLNI